jgi:hypothetical protein
MGYLDLARKAKEEYRKQHGTVVDEQPGLDIVLGERPIAVLIDSTVLGAPVWFSFLTEFDPSDGVPVFYADELEMLKRKPVETVRKIYEAKKAFGPGTRLTQ